VGAQPGTWPQPGAAGEPAPVVPKSKTGLIVGLLVAVVVVGGGIAAAVVALGGRTKGPAVAPGAGDAGALIAATGPAVPPPATQPVAPTGAPAGVSTVTLKLVVTPPDARVELDGVAVPDKALKLSRGNETHKLVFSAPGYVTQTREVRATTDGDILVTLEKPRAVRPVGPKPPGAKPPGVKTKRGPVEDDL
jgi:hypothetical protein